MDRLFRPWRMAYVSGPKTEACFLCEAVVSEDDASNLVVARGSYGLVILNRYPYNSGHVMIAPLRHVADLADLRSEERLGIMDLLVETLPVLGAEFNPDGSNVGINLGRAAGAGVPDHVHVHVVPRWVGDTNFMPVLGETMVLPESLEDTFLRLRRRFELARDQPGD
ncbi:MAG TPA: HIT domain-containing protein [Actinomycetota bacterium]|nr:HIT domain-containing protein [Actinomycetota bacterium]